MAALVLSREQSFFLAVSSHLRNTALQECGLSNQEYSSEPTVFSSDLNLDCEERSASSSCGFVEEAVDVLSRCLTHDELQLPGLGVAELLDAGEVLQQGLSFDLANSRDLLDQSQNQRVQQLKRRPPPEGVLPALPIDLGVLRAKCTLGSDNTA